MVKVDKLQITFKGAEGTKIYGVRRKAILDIYNSLVISCRSNTGERTSFSQYSCKVRWNQLKRIGFVRDTQAAGEASLTPASFDLRDVSNVDQKPRAQCAFLIVSAAPPRGLTRNQVINSASSAFCSGQSWQTQQIQLKIQSTSL